MIFASIVHLLDLEMSRLFGFDDQEMSIWYGFHTREMSKWYGFHTRDMSRWYGFILGRCHPMHGNCDGLLSIGYCWLLCGSVSSNGYCAVHWKMSHTAPPIRWILCGPMDTLAIEAGNAFYAIYAMPIMHTMPFLQFKQCPLCMQCDWCSVHNANSVWNGIGYLNQLK